MLNIEPDDAVNACLHIRRLADPDFCQTHYVIFCTHQGIVKKTCLADYSRPRANGVNAINIREDDRVVSVALTNGTDEIVVANRNGRAIRFNEDTVRAMGRTATGVRAIRLDENDPEDGVVGMVCVNNPDKETVLVVSEKGFGKRSAVTDYRVTNRGGKGVKTLDITEKIGKVVAIKAVTDEEDLMIINKSGTTIRLKLKDVRVQGRATQGSLLINLEKRGDTISSVCQVPTEEEEQTDELTTETPEEVSDMTTDAPVVPGTPAEETPETPAEEV